MLQRSSLKINMNLFVIWFWGCMSALPTFLFRTVKRQNFWPRSNLKGKRGWKRDEHFKMPWRRRWTVWRNHGPVWNQFPSVLIIISRRTSLKNIDLEYFIFLMPNLNMDVLHGCTWADEFCPYFSWLRWRPLGY